MEEKMKELQKKLSESKKLKKLQKSIITFYGNRLKPSIERYRRHRWHRKVLKKDGYQCDICGITQQMLKDRGQALQAHHKYHSKFYPNKRFIIKYGVALCPDHHRKFHQWNGGTKQLCTPECYDEWRDTLDDSEFWIHTPDDHITSTPQAKLKQSLNKSKSK